VVKKKEDVDARDKRGHDESKPLLFIELEIVIP
jgi:hypothetical protein